jgi:inositol phosphorylceramide mannosyltransferase catalytic subunit
MTANDWRSRLPDNALGDRIPRILHQTYASSKLPEALRLNVDELTQANPGWDHRLYDDAAIEHFIAEHYGADVLAAYRRIDPKYGAARADLFRYLAVYRLGGVYLDIKSRFTRPIDEVLAGDEQFVISRWNNAPGETYENFGMHRDLAQVPGGEIQQWHVIAAPGHPFLRAVIERVLTGIDEYSPWRTGVGKIGVLRLTGPIAYTLAITPLLGRYPCKVVPDQRSLALEYSIAGNYSHQQAFGQHYSQHDTPIVALPPISRMLGLAYTQAKRLKARLSQSAGQ